MDTEFVPYTFVQQDFLMFEPPGLWVLGGGVCVCVGVVWVRGGVGWVFVKNCGTFSGETSGSADLPHFLRRGILGVLLDCREELLLYYYWAAAMMTVIEFSNC
jgi:hypothetical protein